jgi:hypothetical protein
MNEKTFGSLMSMSATQNRPLWGQLPGGALHVLRLAG